MIAEKIVEERKLDRCMISYFSTTLAGYCYVGNYYSAHTKNMPRVKNCMDYKVVLSDIARKMDDGTLEITIKIR